MSNPSEHAADLVIASPPSKLAELMTSRRFLGSLASAVAAVVCFRYGLIDADKAAAWVEHSVGIYVLMIGGQDVAKAWRENGARLIETIPVVKSTLLESDGSVGHLPDAKFEDTQP